MQYRRWWGVSARKRKLGRFLALQVSVKYRGGRRQGVRSEINQKDNVKPAQATSGLSCYSSDTHYPTIKQSIPRSKFSRVEKATSPEPPSPTVTLPPPVNVEDEKFCEFPMQAGTTVIGLQNSLRAFLGARFPAGENGYTQYSFSTTPEADRLWKPVFRNDQNASIGDEGRTVDQIIALGCEDGVKKEFFSQISGQVERLGTKRDGLSRSGKLDLR